MLASRGTDEDAGSSRGRRVIPVAPILLGSALILLVLVASTTGPAFHSTGYATLRNIFQQVMDDAPLTISHLKEIATLPSASILRHEDTEEYTRQQERAIVCKYTSLPSVCKNELWSFPIEETESPLKIVGSVLTQASRLVSQAFGVATRISTQKGISLLEEQCATDCATLLLGVEDHVLLAHHRLSTLEDGAFNSSSVSPDILDVKVWLSTAFSYQAACTDNFEVAPGSVAQEVMSSLSKLRSVLAMSMELTDGLSRFGNAFSSWPPPNVVDDNVETVTGQSKTGSRAETSQDELFLHGIDESNGFPYWVSPSDRTLLQSSPSAITANAVVAKDGSGKYTTVAAAVSAIPSSFSGRYVIYIKTGVYNEVLNVTKDKKNITFVGDGIGKTVITGNRNVASGDYNTYRTSTVGIDGSGFYAVNMTFRNTAGPDGHQAVALRAAADYLVFYLCSFEGYQDTLYALSSRQFYRECQIYGTVDYMFGNAVAVFQNCALWARKPNQGQQNTYTAQGRELSADVSGYSFHNCALKPDSSLAQAEYTVQTYLGRPWKAYSRTVFLQSELQSLIQPQGWLPWNASNPFTDTVYYGEYGNRGAGADTSKRVSWGGVHPAMSKTDASKFSLASFLGMQSWLDALGVPYQANLS